MAFGGYASIPARGYTGTFRLKLKAVVFSWAKSGTGGK